MMKVKSMMPTSNDPLTPEQMRNLAEIAQDANSPSLMRETARRVLADPTKSREAYANDLRAALDRLAGQIPASVPFNELEDEARAACAEVRRERLGNRAEATQTGIGG
jgi:hypothetical protein